MNPATRPPPTVMFVHDGLPYESHVTHLIDAGLRVTEVQAHMAVATATTLQPDIIVLDFDRDGDVTEQLKGSTATRHIPIIALMELTRPA